MSLDVKVFDAFCGLKINATIASTVMRRATPQTMIAYLTLVSEQKNYTVRCHLRTAAICRLSTL
jgi:hypothetical protein